MVADGTTVAARNVERPKVDVHELVREQRIVGVVEDGAQSNRPGGRVDLVVDGPQHAGRPAVRLRYGPRPRTDSARSRRIAASTEGRSASGTVNSTEIGRICVMTTMPFASLERTRLPTSTCRRPSFPVTGAMMRVNESCSLALLTCASLDWRAPSTCFTSASCAVSCCSGNQLLRRQGLECLEVCLGVVEPGHVLGPDTLRLGKRDLVRPGVDFGQ